MSRVSLLSSKNLASLVLLLVWIAVCVLAIDIEGNFHAPVWKKSSYETSIPETQRLGVPFLRVTATDEDSQAPHNTVNYVLETATYSNGQVSALEYFHIDPHRGDISLRQSVGTIINTASTFTLTVQAHDLGYPQKVTSERATITVTVLRNTQ